MHMMYLTHKTNRHKQLKHTHDLLSTTPSINLHKNYSKLLSHEDVALEGSQFRNPLSVLTAIFQVNLGLAGVY